MKHANARYSNMTSVYNSSLQCFFLNHLFHAAACSTPSFFDLCAFLSSDLISLVSDQCGASLQ